MCCLMGILAFVAQSVCVVLALLAFLIGAVCALKMVYQKIFPEPSASVVKNCEVEWFGKEPAVSEDTSVQPFKISVPDEVLQDLKERLSRTRFEDPVEDNKFLYGFNPNYLKKVVDYWRKDYDWRENERMLNRFPQFKTRIEGIDIHFMHVKPNLPEDSKLKLIPLMVIHGWPGSVMEFHKIIPLLTTPRPDHDFVFEVICPSIPGYGFSESPHRQGFTCKSAARIFARLMERIGHRKFYVQGGDWGSEIAQNMARYHSSKILGLHLNMYFCDLTLWEGFKFCMIALFPFLIRKAEYKMCFPIKKVLKMCWREGGYFHIQSTKPDSVGSAITDSPAGMAAYILEKLSCWTNPEYAKLDDGGLTEKFTLDELLTNVMLYWINNNFTASVRFYKENMDRMPDHSKNPVTVPSAVAVFPNEILMLPKTCMSEHMKNLISYNIMPRGGHFAAFEEPELLANDVWQFVKLVEK